MKISEINPTLALAYAQANPNLAVEIARQFQEKACEITKMYPEHAVVIANVSSEKVALDIANICVPGQSVLIVRERPELSCQIAGIIFNKGISRETFCTLLLEMVNYCPDQAIPLAEKYPEHQIKIAIKAPPSFALEESKD